MIKIKSARQIEEMKSAGALSKTALRRVGEAVVPGVTTLELDAIAESSVRLAPLPPSRGIAAFPEPSARA